MSPSATWRQWCSRCQGPLGRLACRLPRGDVVCYECAKEVPNAPTYGDSRDHPERSGGGGA